MRKRDNFILLFQVSCSMLLLLCSGCKQGCVTEKYQGKRDNVIDVRQKVKEIVIKDVLIGGISQLNILNDYLIISDYKAFDNIVHVIDKHNFQYVAGTANRGQGPGEITNMVCLETDEAHRTFYITDHGKQKVFGYNLDSVLANPSSYMPEVKTEIKERLFSAEYRYIDDTKCIGAIMEPTGNSGYKQFVAKWNMNTGEITPMKYMHPDIERKRVHLDVSVEHDLYVECYLYHDLITVCDLDGNLKYNIYGPDWDSTTSNQTDYFGDVRFCKDKIIASYLGEKYIQGNYPTQFLVFDLEGNYIQTLDAGYKIVEFCYDSQNNRIIMSLNDEIQFAYLDMKSLI